MDLFTKTQQSIIQEIIDGNTTLTALSNTLQISKPALSKHLKHLQHHHIISGTYEKTPQGRIITYRLQPFTLIYSYDQTTNTCVYFTTETPLNHQFPLI